MKKLLTIATLSVALACAANAADGNHKAEDAPAKNKPAVATEKKALKKELLDKYDTNKNKRLDKEERSKMTPEDLEKWNSISGPPKAKPADGEKPAKAKQ